MTVLMLIVCEVLPSPPHQPQVLMISVLCKDWIDIPTSIVKCVLRRDANLNPIEGKAKTPPSEELTLLDQSPPPVTIL